MKTESKKITASPSKRKLYGIVVSNSMGNTAAVKVTTKMPHPIYGKVVQKWKKYMADTNGLTINVGDSVTIQESRSISKNKKWVVISKQ